MSSWRDSIIDAITRLGGEGPYEEIYAEVAAQRSSLPPSWQAVVRRTIQQSSSDSRAFRPNNGDLFSAVAGIGRGRWGLREAGVRSVAERRIAEPGSGGQGYVVDSAVRRAIELHAVQMAVDHYLARGALDVTEVGKPYDLRVYLPRSEIHVEVKGSTRRLDAVTLTSNEVAHARSTEETELFVVDEISLTTNETGRIETKDGRVRLWKAWIPSDASLTPTVFLHSLNADTAEIFVPVDLRADSASHSRVLIRGK